MGRKRKAPNTVLSVKRAVRFTPDEWSQIQLKMENSDYESISKFFRDMLLKGHISYKKVSITPQSVCEQICGCIKGIKRIESNYIQFTKKYLAIVDFQSSLEHPFLDTKVTNPYFNHLAEKIRSVDELKNQLAEIILSLEHNDQ